MSEITVLGLDNVLLDVGDLEAAKGFYAGRLGLGVKFDCPDAGVVGFRLGDEEAGLVVRAGDVPPGPPRPSPRLWLEVPDARAAGKALAAAATEARRIRRRIQRRAARTVWPSSQRVRSLANFRASGYRSSGCGANARRTIASNSDGTSGRMALGDGGSASIRASAIESVVSPPNGRVPANAP